LAGLEVEAPVRTGRFLAAWLLPDSGRELSQRLKVFRNTAADAIWCDRYYRERGQVSDRTLEFTPEARCERFPQAPDSQHLVDAAHVPPANQSERPIRGAADRRSNNIFFSAVETRLTFQCGSAAGKLLLIFPVPLTAAVKSGEVGERDTITSRKHNAHVTSF
jgi:hypothetical protein